MDLLIVQLFPFVALNIILLNLIKSSVFITPAIYPKPGLSNLKLESSESTLAYVLIINYNKLRKIMTLVENLFTYRQNSSIFLQAILFIRKFF